MNAAQFSRFMLGFVVALAVAMMLNRAHAQIGGTNNSVSLTLDGNTGSLLTGAGAG